MHVSLSLAARSLSTSPLVHSLSATSTRGNTPQQLEVMLWYPGASLLVLQVRGCACTVSLYSLYPHTASIPLTAMIDITSRLPPIGMR